MTRRGRLTLSLGFLTYLVARLFGSRPLYPVAFGLLLTVAAAVLAVRLARRPTGLLRDVGSQVHVEGDDVTVRLELVGTVRATSLVVVERIRGFGERAAVLQRGRGGYVLAGVRRGRYLFDEARVLLEDPFGLARAEVPLHAAAALLVQPRLVELECLFSDDGALPGEGRRLLLRRPSGFDLHSVREYEQGESLRKVHWRSTARRGELMVKELEQAPQDEVAILLDAQAGAGVGDSFDVQVRAAGSLLRAHTLRGRRGLLVVSGAQLQTQRVRSGDADWRAALDVLAAAEPNGRTPASALLAGESGPLPRALELTVVTSTLGAKLVERLLAGARSRRVSLVWVDAASFGRSAASAPQAALLRLEAGGVPLAVVRAGDDLRAKLGSERSLERAHA